MVETSEFCHEEQVGRGHLPGQDSRSAFRTGYVSSTAKWVVSGGGERVGMFILISEFPTMLC